VLGKMGDNTFSNNLFKELTLIKNKREKSSSLLILLK